MHQVALFIIGKPNAEVLPAEWVNGHAPEVVIIVQQSKKERKQQWHTSK